MKTNAPSLRVLRVIYDLQVGGVQRMMLKLLPSLQSHGIETRVCCLKEEGDMASLFRQHGIQVSTIPFRSRLDPVALWRLRNLVSREKIDVVHSHMYASNMAVNMAMAFSGVGVVNSYHSQTPFANTNQARMARMTRSIPDRIIAVSGSVKDALAAGGLPAGKVVTIHNGAEIDDSFTAPSVTRNDGVLRLVWAGRFVKQKRPGFALDVIASSVEAGIPVHLTFVGDGPLREAMEKTVRDRNLSAHVAFVGWQTDIRPFLDSAHLYISTSEREGFPNTLLEACSRGRGFLVQAIEPNRELLGTSNAGFILPPEVAAWREKLRIIHAQRELITECGEAARSRAKEFSVDATCRKMMEMYREMVEVNGGVGELAPGNLSQRHSIGI